MKTTMKLTDKYLARLGMPLELLDEIPEENRCVKRMSVDACEAEGLCFPGEEDKDEWVRGVISTVDPDADGDVVPPEAFEWSRYQKNPIVLFNHDMNSPIGFSDDVSPNIDAGMVSGRTRFGTTAEAQKVYQLLKDKVLRTFSVSFIPAKFVLRGQAGFKALLESLQARYPGRIDGEKVGRILQRAIVVEYSVVTVPNNENTVVLEMKALRTPPAVVVPAVPVVPEVPPIPEPEKPISIRRVGVEQYAGITVKRLGKVEELEGAAELKRVYREMWGV